ncbi:MAG: hypothetical protein JNM40_05455 [Myxococcales bacterium]|nr:hypothetical protein [Myxococcales bacterium]
MPKLRSAEEATKLVQEKQQLEVSLAWELLEIFNKTKDLIDPLRDCADLAIQEMICIRDGIGPESVQAAIDAEKGIMQLLKKQRVTSKLKDDGTPKTKSVEKAKNLEILLREVPKLDAQEVSDVVRLYGTFVEKAAENGKLASFYKEVNAKKDGFRKGSGKINDKAVWNQLGKGDKTLDTGRHRNFLLGELKDDKTKATLETLKKALPKNEYDALIVDLIAEIGANYEKTSRGAVQNFLVSMQGGQAAFALADTSTVGRLDRVFGLVPAADISGTTADTIFFLSKFPKIDPIFYVLPLATIVAGAHHSLIEVALPLSQNGFIDYHIGFYSSLYPSSTKHSAAAAIKKALEMAEKEALNHYLLVFYSKDGKKIEGAYEFLPSEKDALAAFRKFAKATDAMALFSKQGKLDKDSITELANKAKIPLK